MSKIYAFIIIIPMIAILLFKTIAFYEFDTKQRYIKNSIDSVSHKVMITGVLTAGDKEEMLTKLNMFGNFGEDDIILESGSVNADGVIYGMSRYTTGDILDRGEIFSIFVQSDNKSLLSGVEGDSDEHNKLCYKAKAVCRVEKKQDRE